MIQDTNKFIPKSSNQGTAHPLERVRLCERGKELERNKQFPEAYKHYRQAADLGSIEAKQILRKIEQREKEKSTKDSANNRHSFLAKLATGLFFVLFSVLSFGVYQLFFASPAVSSSSAEAEIVAMDTVYKKDDLLYLIVYTALEHFYVERGEYPKDLTELIQLNPENWLSFIPEEMVYKSDGSTYTLAYKEVTGFTKEDLFELHFYQKTNELALISGNYVLAKFPVASNKEGLPFKTSKVIARVVEPNGKGSAFGTRGLVLENAIAIHGTNNPNSIGEYSTKESLRLFNPDIEMLYPYISKGTPLIVKNGTPSKPMYTMNLPILHRGNIPFENETTPNIIYKWKN